MLTKVNRHKPMFPENADTEFESCTFELAKFDVHTYIQPKSVNCFSKT
jgi:hypothetical protein